MIADIKNQAMRIDLLNFRTPQMRAFHMSWFAFFLCFFAWFGIAPLMPAVREEMGLTPAQIGNLIIGSVAVTVLARLLVGWLCDRIGPRYTYSGLMVAGSLPVMGIGLAQSYETLLCFRMAIGIIGASFVITQYHTSVMFAPERVGTANATTAGWGNLGGGVTQLVMPLLLSAFLWLGTSAYWGWRLAMVVAGAVCLLTGIAYVFLTQDTPEGNFHELRARGRLPRRQAERGTFLLACQDYRVWILFLLYGACFGIELTINNIAATYYFDNFNLDMKTAGLVAGLFGLMNLFARTLGGVVGDRFGHARGLDGRVQWLFIALFVEGVALLVFSQMTGLATAITAMIVFSLFVQMSEGATYSVVPFINRRALGAVSGIVGAGGNAGAVAAGLLFKTPTESWPTALWTLGFVVSGTAFLTLLCRPAMAEQRVLLRPHPALARGALMGRPALVVDAEDARIVERYTGFNRFRKQHR